MIGRRLRLEERCTTLVSVYPPVTHLTLLPLFVVAYSNTNHHSCTYGPMPPPKRQPGHRRETHARTRQNHALVPQHRRRVAEECMSGHAARARGRAERAQGRREAGHRGDWRAFVYSFVLVIIFVLDIFFYIFFNAGDVFICCWLIV